MSRRHVMQLQGLVAALIWGIGAAQVFDPFAGFVFGFCFLVGWLIRVERINP